MRGTNTVQHERNKHNPTREEEIDAHVELFCLFSFIELKYLQCIISMLIDIEVHSLKTKKAICTLLEVGKSLQICAIWAKCWGRMRGLRISGMARALGGMFAIN